MSKFAINSLLVFCGLLLSTVGTLAVTVWMAWNIPGRLDDLSRQTKVIVQDVSRK